MEHADLIEALALDREAGREGREPVLETVDRVCELCFGLFMALTFVGAVSAVTAGQDSHRILFHSALGCNLAWGLADGVMYLVRNLTDRGRRLGLARALRDDPDPAHGVRRLRAELSAVMKTLVSDAELEVIRARMARVSSLPAKPGLTRRDYLAALAIFAMVVAGTFPVALPFLMFTDTGTALVVSRVLTLAMLFACGLGLGRSTGSGGWKSGLAMTVLGVVLVTAIIALGG